MANYHRFPILIDELKTLTISFLSKHKYLKYFQYRRGGIKWTRNGLETASAGLFVEIDEGIAFVEISYNYNGEPVKTRYNLTSTPSNLGKGLVWYFVCPETLKRFKTLYLYQGYFYTRPQLKGAMYEKQTYSENIRQLGKKFEIFFGSEKAYEMMNKKYFKSHYKGKPTKKYLKALELIERSKTVDESELL